MKCRHCQATLSLRFIDLGTAPPSNAYLDAAQLAAPERWYPLRVLVCTRCWLVQTEDYTHRSELFSADYAYFSSYSSSWLAHSSAYVDRMTERLRLGPASRVVEVACNDGYLLQYVQARGIPCLGIEPTANTAQAARSKGLDVREAFFGMALATALAGEGHRADLMVANNVLAHVPDINDFVAGFATLLKPQGVATFEFPHLMRLVEECQFDTIYHEHFSYLSLTAAHRVFEANGLEIFDVETLPTHGGSLRVYAQRIDGGMRPRSSALRALLDDEQAAGISTPTYYEGLQARAEAIKNALLRFLIDSRDAGRKVMAYGAAAKGNTLLNYSGVRPDLLPLVADLNPAKQNKYLPGSRIPIHPVEAMLSAKPDYVLILPWNLRGEIRQQLSSIGDWGGRFVTAVPSLRIL